MEELTDLVKGSAMDLRDSAEVLLHKAEAENSEGYFNKIIENLTSDVTFFDSLSKADNFQQQFELSGTYEFSGVGKAQVGHLLISKI